MILTHTRHSLGGKSNNIHGILFDVAWLWEEYLNTIFKDDFIHPRNKQNSGGIAVFVDGKRIVYPDFYNKKIDMIVDAKYKDLTDQSISREDLYQIISYSYILESKIAGVVFPSKNESKLSKIGKLSGYGANIFKQSFHIPQQVHVYREFDACIKKSEDDFKIKLKDYYIEIQKHNKEAES